MSIPPKPRRSATERKGIALLVAHRARNGVKVTPAAHHVGLELLAELAEVIAESIVPPPYEPTHSYTIGDRVVRAHQPSDDAQPRFGIMDAYEDLTAAALHIVEHAQVLGASNDVQGVAIPADLFDTLATIAGRLDCLRLDRPVPTPSELAARYPAAGKVR